MTALKGALPCCGWVRNARVPSPKSTQEVFAPIYFFSDVAPVAKAAAPITPPPRPFKKFLRESPSSSFVSFFIASWPPFYGKSAAEKSKRPSASPLWESKEPGTEDRLPSSQIWLESIRQRG